MSNENLKTETLALHAGHTPDQETLSRSVPVYRTSSYVFKNTEHAANLFSLKELGNIYTRLMTQCPTLRVILCSGYPIEGPARDILDAGADGFVQKPFSITHLSEMLQALIRRDGRPTDGSRGRPPEMPSDRRP